GGVERLNRTITETLRRLVGRTDEWEESLPYAVYCYNTVPHGVTGESPAFLFYGRDKRLPLGESWKVDERYAGDMDDYKSQMMMLMKKTQVEVNERLSGERERMKREYDKRRENNNGNEPVVGDRFYAFKENGNERNPKLRTNVIVDAGSPLHWESRCPEYAKDPRKLKELWKKCPDQYANFSFEKLKEYALMRSLIERWTMDWRFFLEGIDDTYNVAYHRGLGEDVESSCGHAAILLSPNLDLPSNGGDTARFEWRETVSEEWENTLRRWDGERARKKPIAKILIFWPRKKKKMKMEYNKKVIIELVQNNCWTAMIAPEPCGVTTEAHYDTFLLDWSGEKQDYGIIRVLTAGNVTTDGTPVAALHKVYKWMTRHHWEYAIESWSKGKQYDPLAPMRELPEEEINKKEIIERKEALVARRTFPVKKSGDEQSKKLEDKICDICHEKGHIKWKCPDYEKKRRPEEG
ncbi:hypothetical protein PENTCL1PPCAC_568, partial [Pristionchus entomophagus]